MSKKPDDTPDSEPVAVTEPAVDPTPAVNRTRRGPRPSGWVKVYDTWSGQKLEHKVPPHFLTQYPNLKPVTSAKGK